MSFILDALKKSETERQQQSSAEFAAVPSSDEGPRVPRWLWVLGLLLAFNLIVLLGLFLRPATVPSGSPSAPATGVLEPQPGAATPTTATLPDPAQDEQSFAEQLAVAKQSATARAAAVAPDAPASPPAAADVTPGVVYSATPGSSAVVPTFLEVRANGVVTLPDLHLDIHVYSNVPADRFVFINMSKQRENSRLAEGPLVEEITPQGVILEYRGTSFLLTRD